MNGVKKPAAASNMGAKKPVPPMSKDGAHQSSPKLATPRPPTGASPNGYVPLYTAPKEDQPIIVPAANVENKIDLPTVLQITTMKDLEDRILTNASVLYPAIKIKVTTVIAPSGLMVHALLLRPKNAERDTSRWTMEVKGPGINSEKTEAEVGRRKALEALLGELEKRVGKEMLDS